MFLLCIYFLTGMHSGSSARSGHMSDERSELYAPRKTARTGGEAECQTVNSRLPGVAGAQNTQHSSRCHL